MSRSLLWKTAVFIVFAFALTVVFFWVREGSLREAGASMDTMFGHAGSDVAEGAGSVVDATTTAVDRATDGDDRT
jgi:hypothetical protein